MKLSKIAAVGAALFAMSATAASAAPGAGLGSKPGVASGIIQVHGVHGRCELGPAGWHRNPRPGVRIACRPPRPRGAYWMWRSEGPRHGWYHRHEKRWWN